LLRIFRAPCQHGITKRFSAQQLYWVSTLEKPSHAYIDTHRLRTRLLDGLLCQSG
jgi:hypothetical protein